MSLLYLYCMSLLSGSQVMSLVETRLSFILDSFRVLEMLKTLCFLRKRLIGLASGLFRQNWMKLSQRLCLRIGYSMYTNTFGAFFSMQFAAEDCCSWAGFLVSSDSRKAQQSCLPLSAGNFIQFSLSLRESLRRDWLLRLGLPAPRARSLKLRSYSLRFFLNCLRIFSPPQAPSSCHPVNSPCAYSDDLAYSLPTRISNIILVIKILNRPPTSSPSAHAVGSSFSISKTALFYLGLKWRIILLRIIIKDNNKMQQGMIQRVHYEKENDFKKGNKNRQAEMGSMHKWPHSDKLYQSVSTSIQLKPTFLRKKTLSNTAQFCTLYAEQLLRAETNAQPCPRFLGRHEIDVQLRAKMLDWMVEVTSSYRFANKTYFDGVQIMDRYFEAEPEALPPARLHLIGVQCMLIASKMNEVFPLKTRTVFEKIGHRKLPLEDLLAMEERIMKRLDYHLNSWTFFDLAMLKLAEYHAYEEARRDAMGRLAGDEGTPEDRLKRLEELCAFICKHLVFEYDFLCENSMTAVAEACVKGVLEISGANSQPVCFFSSSPITLELAKQKVFKIMRRFKGNFNALGNIFRFTPEEVLTQVAEFSWN